MITNDKYISARNLLQIVRQETDSIGVAVSFGKDSLVTLDLCCQVFSRVEGYYLYRVRGLRIVDEWAGAVMRRHGVRVRMYPHFDLSRCYRNAVLQPHWRQVEKTPRVKMSDIEAGFRSDANVDWIAYGWRRNDSMSRAMIMKATGGFDANQRRVFPIRSWRRKEVLDYLTSRGIPLPYGLGRKDQGGLDFHPEALRALRDQYPDDYAKWIADFPFSGVQLAGESDSDCGGSNSLNLPLTGNSSASGRTLDNTHANSRDGSTSQQAAAASSSVMGRTSVKSTMQSATPVGRSRITGRRETQIKRGPR